MDNGWYIQGEGGTPISEYMEEQHKRYNAVADFFGVAHHNGTIREIEFLEALVDRFKKLESGK